MFSKKFVARTWESLSERLARLFFTGAWACYALASAAYSQEPPAAKAPEELRLWLLRDTATLEYVNGRTYRAHDMKTLDIQTGDMDGDGVADYLVAVEAPQDLSDDADCLKRRQKDPELRCGVRRYLLVVTRNNQTSFTLAKLSKNALLCSDCGGVMGDPYRGITVGRKTFTIRHDGGSSEKWGTEVTFGYSNRDKTWQLVQVRASETRRAGGDRMITKERRYAPPYDYGKIDFADFDPDDYLGKGEGYAPRKKK